MAIRSAIQPLLNCRNWVDRWIDRQFVSIEKLDKHVAGCKFTNKPLDKLKVIYNNTPVFMGRARADTILDKMSRSSPCPV